MLQPLVISVFRLNFQLEVTALTQFTAYVLRNSYFLLPNDGGSQVIISTG